MTDSTTKIRYLRDPKNKERVLTLATSVDGDTLSFAIAMNAPSRTFSDPYGDSEIPGDSFTRANGRRLALGRLATVDRVSRNEIVKNDPSKQDRWKVKFDAGTQHPLIQVLSVLTTYGNGTVARIAQHELDVFSAQQAERAEKRQAENQTKVA